MPDAETTPNVLSSGSVVEAVTDIVFGIVDYFNPAHKNPTADCHPAWHAAERMSSAREYVNSIHDLPPTGEEFPYAYVYDNPSEADISARLDRVRDAEER